MKHQFLRQLGCGMLALTLVLGMTACACKPESGASGSFKGDLPTKSDASLEEPNETVETASSAKPAHPGKQQPSVKPDETQYNDSLIVDAYADAGDASTEWGESYHYEVRIPELLCNSADAKALNAEIMDIYGEDAKRAPDSDTIKYSIGWQSHWDGSLLSLELTAGQPDGETYHDIYYFDFASETRLTEDDVLTRMGLSWQTIEPALVRTAAREHDRMMQAQDVEFTNDLIADTLALRAQSVLAAQDAALPLYPNADGTLTVYLNLATYAGAGWMQTACIVDANEKAVPLSTGYEFVTAAVDTNGAVTVTYHEDGDEFSGVDYQNIYGFAFDTPYTIRGCFGSYTDLFIGNVGSSFEPYLFLKTEDGTLEYVDLFRCVRYETYVCGGPLYGISGVTALSAGIEEKTDYSYATVYAQDSSGKTHDLLETVYLSDALPYDLAKGFAATGESGEWCSLSLDVMDGIHAQRGSASYTGFPLRLGVSEDGLIYALDFWDEAGIETLSICSLLPGNGMLVLTQLAGGSPFGLSSGETLYLTETYG